MSWGLSEVFSGYVQMSRGFSKTYVLVLYNFTFVFLQLYKAIFFVFNLIFFFTFTKVFLILKLLVLFITVEWWKQLVDKINGWI